MRRQLDRLLRIRQSLEHVAQLELQRNAQEIRRVELAAERHGRLALAARSNALASLEAEDVQAPEWLLAAADTEMLRWKRARLGKLIATRRPALEAVRGEMLTRRLERRQVETLITANETAREKKQHRREQDLVDDWFRSRAVRNRSETD